MADRDSVKTSVGRSIAVVIGAKTEYAYGTDNYFATDQAMGTQPTQYIDLTSNMGSVDIKRFLLESVKYYLDVNGGVYTYQLYLLEAASADNVQQLSDIVFDSYNAQAEATAYERNTGGGGAQGAVTTVDLQLPKIVTLSVKNRLYYMIDWNVAPGGSSAQGYIKIRGRLLK